MISNAVMQPTYANRRASARALTNCVVASAYALRQPSRVLDTDELLARLEERRIRNIDIARTLGLPDSRVPEIRRKDRKLSLDEGAKLVRAFGLEQAHAADPILPEVNRLIVRHIALRLGAAPDEPRIQDLAEDLRAFSEFVADPKARRSLEAAEGFFRAMSLRHPKAEAEARRESDPRPAR